MNRMIFVSKIYFCFAVGLTTLPSGAKVFANTAKVEKIKSALMRTEKFSPKEFSNTMENIAAIGIVNVEPIVIEVLSDVKAPADRIYFSCEVAERFGSAAISPHLEKHLTQKKDHVRSACTAAYGRTMARGPADSAKVTAAAGKLFDRILLEIKAGNCHVAKVAAQGMGLALHQSPAAAKELTEWVSSGRGCQQQTAMWSLLDHNAVDNSRAGKAALDVFNNDSNTPSDRASALNLIGKVKYKDAADSVRSFLSNGIDPGGNMLGAACAVQGDIGNPSDTAILQKVAKNDPHGASGFVAKKCRDGIKALKRK